MAVQLPEQPQPFSVISEKWQNKLNIPSLDEGDKYSFGQVYEDQLFNLVHKHLELNTNDRLAYIGPGRGSLASKIKDKFCLLEPMVNIFPGKTHYEETPNQRMLPFKIAHVGAEEYFRELASDAEGYDKKVAPFDKILLRDAVEHFTNIHDTFLFIMKSLSECGKLLIIHRPGPMSTLPFFKSANVRFNDSDVTGSEPYINIIKNLQAINVDVQWEIEIVPIVLPKVKWLSMIKEKFPPQMEIISNYQITSGVRELTEGMFKYQGDHVEFFDRLLFITATHPLVDCGYPSIQRAGQGAHTPYPGLMDLKFNLKVTPDIVKHVNQRLEKEKRDKNPLL